MIWLEESQPSTKFERVTHQSAGDIAQHNDFRRLRSNAFGANVNRPRDTAARKSRGDPEIKRTGPAL